MFHNNTLLHPSSNLMKIATSILLLSYARTTMSLAATASSRAKNIVVVGGGIQGTSVAYHLAKQSDDDTTIVLLEAKAPASAASGKGGGFMARSWGDGGPTQRLHELAFDMYETLAVDLGCTSYRKLPVLSVAPGYNKKGVDAAKRKNPNLGPLIPEWLDGNVGQIRAMGMGDDTAQVTPLEFVEKMLEHSSDKVKVVLGTCTGVKTTEEEDGAGSKKLTAVTYTPRGKEEEVSIPADAMIVSAGPWSCAAEQWFDGAVQLPMEGIKSTSIVWGKPNDENVDATALFCGEDDRFGTHLEVYPRPDGTIYICGIGGSDYVSKEDLQNGAFREDCDAKEARADAAKASFQEMSATYKACGNVDRVQACMRPCPPDATPYMGSVPGYDGAFINAGHNCWGIAWAPACGKAMAELVLEGESSSVNLDPFDPARFTPGAKRGGRGRKKRGLNVGEQW